MANLVILVVTSIFIEYYRKIDKRNSVWVYLVQQGYELAISAITKYEIYSGATQSQLTFWDKVLQSISVITFDETCVSTAVTINANLKRKRKQIDISDLFIAATAVSHNMPLVTLNLKHFERIPDLTVLK